VLVPLTGEDDELDELLELFELDDELLEPKLLLLLFCLR